MINSKCLRFFLLLFSFLLFFISPVISSISSHAVNINENTKSTTESGIESIPDAPAAADPLNKQIANIFKKNTAEIDKKSKKNTKSSGSVFKKEAIINTSIQKYSYELMEKNIYDLIKKYGDLIYMENMGKSVLERNIPVIVLGKNTCKTKILITGGIHGREYITAQLIMKQIEEYLKNYSHDLNGINIKKLLSKTKLYFIPMLNPDGVSLSQYGLSTVSNNSLRSKLLLMNNKKTDFTRWKSNINGVDLNRNFNAEWERIPKAKPSPEKFKGTSPESEPESAGITSYIRKNKFDGLICYHASGSIIYWYNNQTGVVYKNSLKIAKAISLVTKYPLVKPDKNNLQGGLKDWFIITFKKPSVTIEIGKTDKCPVPVSEFQNIWNENKYVPLIFSQLIK